MSCSGDGKICYTNLEYGSTTGAHIFDCHISTTYKVFIIYCSKEIKLVKIQVSRNVNVSFVLDVVSDKKLHPQIPQIN